jgi:hypothetical protein
MAADMIASACATSRGMGHIEFLLYVDNDDPSLDEYRKIHAVHTRGEDSSRDLVTLIVGPRMTKMTEYWNILARAAKGDIFLQANDDIAFRTTDWDKMVQDAFDASPDKILLAHGDDLGCGGARAGAHCFVHKKWVDAVGYFIAPHFSSDYGDTWLNDVANELGRRVVLPVVIEHLHVIYRKMEPDATYRERLARHAKDDVDQLYKDLTPRRALDVAKLRSAIAGRPLWTIMVLTQPSREEYLKRLKTRLLPQLGGAPVDLLIEPCDTRLTVGANRRRMTEKAAGEYVSFIDDDDLVAEDYVARVLPLLDGVDYVGFRVQTFVDDHAIEPTHHALKYGGVGYDERMKRNYRDISHLNPVRRELALRGVMDGGVGEDSRWADSLREQGLLKTEHVVDENEVMYFYYARSRKDDADYKFVTMPPETVATKFDGIGFARETKTCPHCGSGATAPGNGAMICNQCGKGF